jgi:hypothetical protein
MIIPVFCVLALSSGCVYEEMQTEMVVTERVNVQFDEYRESPDIGSAVVVDDFKMKLMGKLDEYGVELEDVMAITMVSGEYKVTKPAKGADWTVTGEVTIKRQDDPSGPVTEGPEIFVNLTSQPLAAAKGMPVPADLNSAGVTVVNNALADLKMGGDPRLIVTMESDDITPAPSPSNPLEFKWMARIVFQIVINTSVSG